jgi:hypothetical protein
MTQMAPRPSRRVFLALLTVAGALSATAAYVWKANPEALIGKILRRRFPDVQVSSSSVAALTRDIIAARFQTFGRRLALEGGSRAAGIIGLEPLAEWKLTAEQFSQLERKIVTFFILGSNFLDVKDPKSDLVTYVAMPEVCPNRFAQYDW